MEIKYNEKLAELVGLSFGDGSLTIRKETGTPRFQLRGHITEDREHYDNHIIPLFNEEICIPLLNRKVPTIESRKSMQSYGIAIQNQKVGEFLNASGIPTGVKAELHIPEWIKENKTLSCAFLRGLCDTDGGIHCQKNYSIKNREKHTQIRLKIATTSMNLIEDIKNILNVLQIKCQFRIYQSPVKTWKRVYIAEVCGGIQVNKWFELIGSNNPKHITKYKVWKQFSFCPPRTTLEQRKAILRGILDPYSFYDAGLPERSNGLP